MEGAAVAQVCTEFGIPFSVVRTISDSANEQASIDFPKFIRSVAQVYTSYIIKNLLTRDSS
jgi:adenosylhomocysteine nucleosidase